MVHQAGGIVEIDSRLGSGTTVRMVIPIAEPIPAAEGAIASEDAEATVSGLTRILVIDHDAGVRRFLVESLESLGYLAMEAGDGADGIAAIDSFHPDAVIVDYAMPGMTGAEVARLARAKRPDLPIIFATGYSESDVIEAAVGKEAVVLHKPFKVGDLAAALRGALAAKIGTD